MAAPVAENRCTPAASGGAAAAGCCFAAALAALGGDLAVAAPAALGEKPLQLVL